MKFDIGNIDNYQGEDLVLLMGAPGSRWSNIHLILCEHPNINKSDWSDDKSWNSLSKDLHNTVRVTGGHRGSYWGPGNMYGDGFDRLDKMSKSEILTDFMAAYDTWDGLKVVKSHWFAYNISYIRNLFPKAKIALCYVNDTESFYWWHKQGGWGLGYANYAWYDNDIRLLEKIKEENNYILRFAIDNGLDFKVKKRSELWQLCGLPPAKAITETEAESNNDPRIHVKFALYNGDGVSNLAHLKSSDSHSLRTKGIITK